MVETRDSFSNTTLFILRELKTRSGYMWFRVGTISSVCMFPNPELGMLQNSVHFVEGSGWVEAQQGRKTDRIPLGHWSEWEA